MRVEKISLNSYASSGSSDSRLTLGLSLNSYKSILDGERPSVRRESEEPEEAEGYAARPRHVKLGKKLESHSSMDGTIWEAIYQRR
jgi:hypothetical protein